MIVQTDDTKPVNPGIGIGPITVGMTRAQVLAAMGKPTDLTVVDQDNFKAEGVDVYYDPDSKVATEIRVDGNWETHWENLSIFDTPYSTLKATLKAKDATCLEDPDRPNYIGSDTLGIEFWTNKSEDRPPSEMTVFKRGSRSDFYSE